jgi:hypothetical protein
MTAKSELDRLTLESSRPPTRAAEKRAARRIVAAWIANDVAWALILLWTIRRYRRRQQAQHRTSRQHDARTTD